ncbi:MAG: IgA Peptidase M64 [Tannerellaceae bacterium]|jgi:hypothetical protein|nr:IgA Peptidase M64 [Tannerellaceae bacterium]
MRRRHFLVLFVLLFTWLPEEAYSTEEGTFYTYFELQSLRIDFVLSGNDTSRAASLLHLRKEPLWSAPLDHLVDPFKYGDYFVFVTDPVSCDTLYSRGFNTLFEEWRTTPEAAHRTQAFLNSVLVPFPRRLITVTLSARSRIDMCFYPLLSFSVDPEDSHIDCGTHVSYPVTELVDNGSIHRHVDLLFLAEGYSAAEHDKFLADAQRFTDVLYDTPPFTVCKDRFNVRALFIPSCQSGTDIPHEGVYVHTPLHTSFHTFSIDRYLTTVDIPAVCDARWDVPCDALVLLVNTPVYGGAGIYNFYATVAADNDRSPHIFIHELGHSFAGLADEYFTSEVAYNNFYPLDCEPWEPNITTLVRFVDKWNDLLLPGTPVPTPLMAPYDVLPGVFEGAGYSSKGIYRPMDHCMMRDYAPFCPACSRAILEMIDFFAPR